MYPIQTLTSRITYLFVIFVTKMPVHVIYLTFLCKKKQQTKTKNKNKNTAYSR
jgi:uncharacterized protein (UPF0305 family)